MLHDFRARCGRAAPLTSPRRASHTRKTRNNPHGPREDLMNRALAKLSLGLFAAAFACGAALAQDIKIGTIYDYTGPFAGGGSKAAGIGNKIAIDMINQKGGVEGHKIVGIYAHAQSKTDV